MHEHSLQFVMTWHTIPLVTAASCLIGRKVLR